MVWVFELVNDGLEESEGVIDTEGEAGSVGVGVGVKRAVVVSRREPE